MAVADRIVRDVVPESTASFTDRPLAYELPAHGGYVTTSADHEFGAALCTPWTAERSVIVVKSWFASCPPGRVSRHGPIPGKQEWAATLLAAGFEMLHAPPS